MAHTELVQRKHNTMVMFSFRLYFYVRELIYCYLYAYLWYMFLVGVMPAAMHVLQRWVKSVRDESFRVRIKRNDQYGHPTCTDVLATGQSDTTSQGQKCTRMPAAEVLHALKCYTPVGSDEAEIADSGPFMCIEISSADVNRLAHPLLFPLRWTMWVNERASKSAPKVIQVLVQGLMVLYGAYIIGYYYYYESEYKTAVFRCAIAHETLIPFLYDYVC
jgi:hypothetical protein